MSKPETRPSRKVQGLDWTSMEFCSGSRSHRHLGSEHYTRRIGAWGSSLLIK